MSYAEMETTIAILHNQIRELEAALRKISRPGEGGSPGPDLHECIRIAQEALSGSAPSDAPEQLFCRVCDHIEELHETFNMSHRFTPCDETIAEQALATDSAMNRKGEP